MGITVIPYNPQTDWQAQLGYLIGKGIATNLNNQQLKALSDHINGVAQSIDSVTPDDTTKAENMIASQNGFSDLLGKNGDQVLADNQKKWDELEQQRQDALAAGNQKLADTLGTQQNILHLKSEAIRNVLRKKGVDMTGLGADDNIAAKLAATMVSPQQQQASFAPTGFSSGNSLDFQQWDQATPRQKLGIDSIGIDTQNIQPNSQQRMIGFDQTSLLPPSQNPVTSAKQPSIQLTFADFVRAAPNGDQYSQAVKALATHLAQQRRDPSKFVTDMANWMVQQGITGDNYQKGLDLAKQIAGNWQVQSQAEKNAQLIREMQQALDTGNQAAFQGAAIKYAIVNNVAPKDFSDYIKNATPDYAINDVNLGNAINQTIYDKKGIGKGASVNLGVGINPNTALENQTKIDVANIGADATKYSADKRAQAAVMAANIGASATLQAAQINADKALKIAEMSIENKLDPVSKAIVDTVNGAMTDPEKWKQLNDTPEGKNLLTKYAIIVNGNGSGKITNEEYDQLYNALRAKGYSDEQSRKMIQDKYW